MKKIIVSWVGIVCLLFILYTSVAAVEISVTGNGTSSNQTVTIVKGESIKVVQDSKAAVENNVSAKADTGNNSANGNTGNSSIVTGNATSNVVVTNNINTNTATSPGCCTPTQAATPTQKPTVTPDPGNKPTNTPAPTTKQNDNRDTEKSDNNQNSSNTQNGGIGGPTGEILGLSATSSEENITFQTLALICAGIGLLLRAKANVSNT